MKSLRVVQTQAIFIYEINVGKSRIRLVNFQMGSKLIEDEIIQFKIRSLSDPTLSDIDFKNKMV